jgi:drug/metabolite transporter (DMT)-like permease
MTTFIFFAVLFAAACHAGWNAFIKVHLDPFSVTTLIAIGSALIALPALPIVGLPAFESWPYLVASMIFHLGYYIGLTEAYRHGDMSQVYPIARGSAPLLTASVGALYVGERIGVAAWAGIVILALGILLLSTHGGRDLARIDRRAVGYALFTAVTICGYSLADGVGGRAAQSAHAYAVMLFLLDGVMMVVFAMLRRGPQVMTAILPYWRIGLFAGGLSLAAYWIAIWAMSVAPIGMVAALRETSVLFGAAIAVVFLKEPLRAARIAAAMMIVCGLVLIRIA